MEHLSTILTEKGKLWNSNILWKINEITQHVLKMQEIPLLP